MAHLQALAALLLLTACEPAQPPKSENHVRMAKACMAGGSDAVHCECEATKVDELLAEGLIDPEVVQAVILMAEGKEEEADKIMLSVPYEKRFEQPSLVAEARLECVT